VLLVSFAGSCLDWEVRLQAFEGLKRRTKKKIADAPPKAAMGA
jgi:hypothetical protein